MEQDSRDDIDGQGGIKGTICGDGALYFSLAREHDLKPRYEDRSALGATETV